MAWGYTTNQIEKELEVEESTGGGIGGIFKWTKDALFGSHVSPTRKYKEFAQDDTNYKYRRTANRLHNARSRSNSWSGLDPAFNKRYDLLDDTFNEDDISANSLKGGNKLFEKSNLNFNIDPERKERLRFLLDPVDIHPANVSSVNNPIFNANNHTDTFARRNKQPNLCRLDKFDSLFQSPNQDDQFISRLFGKHAGHSPLRSERRSGNGELPGKFPMNNSNVNVSTRTDYTSEYFCLLDELDKNNKILETMQRDIKERKENKLIQEESYKEKYLQARSELINELKSSKRIYDSYYKLYNRYQELKKISKDALEWQNRIPSLDDRLVDRAISKDKQIKELSEKLLHMELIKKQTETQRDIERLKYESRIKDLESRLSLQKDIQREYNPSSIVNMDPKYNPRSSSDLGLKYGMDWKTHSTSFSPPHNHIASDGYKNQYDSILRPDYI